MKICKLYEMNQDYSDDCEEVVQPELQLEQSQASDDGFGPVDPVSEAFFSEDLAESIRASGSSSSQDNLDSKMASAVNNEWKNLVSASIVSSKCCQLQLPWERGFAAKVFRTGSEVLDIFPKLPRPLPPVEPITLQGQTDESLKILEDKVSLIPGGWQVIASRLASLSFHVSEEDKRQIALGKWRTLLVEAPEKSRLGRQLLLELLSFRGDGYLDQVLLDVFSKKSSNTLNKRADHLLEFFAFCRSLRLSPLPLSEEVFYRFLREVRAPKAATAPKSSRESIAFSELVGFDGAKSILDSARVMGICHRMELTKRVTKKSRLLTRKQLVSLERNMHDPSMWLADRVKSGHDLFCTYGRLRWRDSQWLSKALVDKNQFGEGYLECETKVTKTSTTARKKTTMLPVAVPLKLLETMDFATTFLELRRRAGLPEFGEMDDNGCLFPALPSVDRHGNFTSKPLSTSDAGKWTRELLSHSPHATHDSVEGITSHSFKSTTLAWVSKHGSCTPYERKILGYHADANEDSMHCYSRDVIAEPLRKYTKVIQDVAFGVFDPDSTRSGYFPKAGLDGAEEMLHETEPDQEWSKTLGEVPGSGLEEEFNLEAAECASQGSDSQAVKRQRLDPKVSGEIDEDSVVSSESGDSSSGSDGEDVLLRDLVSYGDVDLTDKTRSESKSLGSLRFVHARLRTLHAGHKLDESRLACGRPLHGGFKLLEESEKAFPFPRCQICFGKQ